MNKIDLNIKNYNGPFELLLDLIKDKKMDIFDINLVELANEYIRIIDIIKDSNIDIAAEYLVLASTLLNLKIKMALYEKEEEKLIEEDKNKILSRLIEYQQFKNIAVNLRKKESYRKNLYIKQHENYEEFDVNDDLVRLDGSSDGIKLVMQLKKMFERLDGNKLKETLVERFNLSPVERREQIIYILNKNANPSFKEIFFVPTINHFVLTMVIILDMARKQEIILRQENQFGLLKIKKGVISE